MINSSFGRPPQFHLQKQLPSDDYDSADDLDNIAEENTAISQKLPESCVNKALYLQTNPASERKYSPLKEKDMNNLHNVRDQPKVNQYSFPSKQTSGTPRITSEDSSRFMNKYQESHLEFQTQANKPTNSPLKSKRHPPSMTMQDYNKENTKQVEADLSESQYTSGSIPQASAFTELGNKLFMQKLYQNNQLRPTDVANVKNQNLLLSNNDAQKINEKRYLASKELQEDVVNRLMRQGDQMNQNNQALTNNYLNSELKECTFAPRIISSGPRRSHQQFLEDQSQFQKQTELKKKRLQEERTLHAKNKEEVPKKSGISQGSLKILEKKKQQEKQPFHQRLYNTGKNSHAKQMQEFVEKDGFDLGRDTLESQFVGLIDQKGDISNNKRSISGGPSTFTPSIHKKSKNLKREGRVDNILYNDALRRQHKSVEISKMKAKSTATPTTMSFASKKALAMRFIKEFDIAILEFLEVGKEPKLSYIQLFEFLKKLCFLKESEQIDSPHFTPDRLHLYDMWYSLYADEKNGIHRRNLLVFLLGILNLHFPITKIQHHADPSVTETDAQKGEEDDESEMDNQFKNPILPGETDPPYERKQIGDIDEYGNFELNEEEVRRLHKIYDLWFINRMCAGDNLGQLISTRSQQEFSYHPEINQTSKNLAQNYREKILEGTADLIQQNKLAAPKDGKITHVDLLIVSKKVTEEKINKYADLLKEEQTRDHTFKPQTTQYSQGLNNNSMMRGEDSESRGTITRKQNGMTAESLGRDRVFELYSLAKPRILKTDKDRVEADYEKNYEECTFQPNLIAEKNSRSFVSEPKEQFVKGIEKTVERMRNARSVKEQQNMQLARGFATGKEGHFVFAVDKKKHGNNNSVSTTGNRKSMQRFTNESRSNIYREEYEYMEGENPDTNRSSNAGGTYFTYEQQMQQYVENPIYGIEQGNELVEIKETENELAEANETENDVGHEPHGNRGHYQPQEEEEEEGQEEEEEEYEQEQEHEHERAPLLFVDVNLGQGKAERIIVYEGDSSEELAHRFSEEHGLDDSMKIKLKQLLDSQIDSLLARIDEEQYSETDRQQYSEYAQEQIDEEDASEEEES